MTHIDLLDPTAEHAAAAGLQRSKPRYNHVVDEAGIRARGAGAARAVADALTVRPGDPVIGE